MALAVMAGSIDVAVAWGQPRCLSAQAKADSKAALLGFPKVFMEAVRFPESGQVESSGVQPRVGLSVSPLDFYASRQLKALSVAECEAQDAERNLKQTAELTMAAPSLIAYRAQADYLGEHQALWRELVRVEQRRFEARVVTVMEYAEVRRLVESLDRKLEQVRGLARLLEARGVKPRGARSLDGVAAAREAAIVRYENEASAVRGLDAWNLKVTGGVVPWLDQKPDWFGVATFGVSLGIFSHVAAENRYLAARRQELRSEGGGDVPRLEEMRRLLRVQAESAANELGVIKEHLELLSSASGALQGANVEKASHVTDALAVERFSVESDRVYLEALITALNDIAKRRP